MPSSFQPSRIMSVKTMSSIHSSSDDDESMQKVESSNGEEQEVMENERGPRETRGRPCEKSKHHRKGHSHSSSRHSSSSRKHLNHSRNPSNESNLHRAHPKSSPHHKSSSSSRRKETHNNASPAHSSSSKLASSPLKAKGKSKDKFMVSKGEDPESEENEIQHQNGNRLDNPSTSEEEEGEQQEVASTSKSSPKNSGVTHKKKQNSKKKKRKSGSETCSKTNRKCRKSTANPKKAESEEPSSSSEGELEILGEYLPEKIVDAGTRKRSDGSTYYKYKIRWKGYKAKDDTWEPEEHLDERQDLIDAFWKKKGKKAPARLMPVKQVKSKLPLLDMVNSASEEDEAFNKEAASEEEPVSGNEDSSDASEEMQDEEEMVKRFVTKHCKGKTWHIHLKEVKDVRERNGEEEAHVVLRNGDEGWCPTERVNENASYLLLAYWRKKAKER